MSDNIKYLIFGYLAVFILIIRYNSKMSSEESDYNNNVNNTPTKKRKKNYKQKFNSDWKHQFSWIGNNNGRAICTICHNKYLSGGVTHLQRHENTSFHINRVKSIKSMNILSMDFLREENTLLSRQSKEAEVKLCAFIAEHNLPLRTMDHLIPLLKAIAPDSEIIKTLNCGRTKTTGIIKALGQENFKNIIDDMKSYPFSLILDETTDVSIAKSMAIVVRYSNNKMQVQDRFLTLMEVRSGTAESLFSAVKSLLDQNEVPYKNLVGFAGDHASVMMGSLTGVQTRLKEINPHIFVLGCVCHSFHTASSYACEKLPRSIEEFIKDVINYFSNSAKRIKQLEEFQLFTQTVHHKLIKLSCTRWLSLQSAVNRIIEQWEPLKLFFIAEVADDLKSLKASKILDAFNNPIYLVYLLFLSYILKIVNDMNLEFQSEKPKLYYLAERLKALYKSILKAFIKDSVMNDKKNPVGKIDPSNPRNFLELKDVYIGAKASNAIINLKVPPKDVDNLKIRLLDFYVCLSCEIKKRFNFECKILNFLSAFRPSIAKSGQIKTISEAVLYFPDLVTDIEELDTEWRLLSEVDALSTVEEADYWEAVSLLKNGLGDSIFPNLIKFVNGTLAFPHSSAAAERVFSKLSLIKTKTRNRLYVESVSSLIGTKELIRETTCHEWVPTKKIITSVRNWKQLEMDDREFEEVILSTV